MANLQFASLDCHGFNSSVASYISSSLAFADCVLLQEEETHYNIASKSAFPTDVLDR